MRFLQIRKAAVMTGRHATFHGSNWCTQLLGLDLGCGLILISGGKKSFLIGGEGRRSLALAHPATEDILCSAKGQKCTSWNNIWITSLFNLFGGIHMPRAQSEYFVLYLVFADLSARGVVRLVYAWSVSAFGICLYYL